MKLLIATVGLPRAGKSTWALNESKDIGAPIVAPDAIRIALHGQAYIQEAERFVWASAHLMVRALFNSGHEKVIFDGTNISVARRDALRDISDEIEVVFHEIKTPAEECTFRAYKTNNEVLIPIIERMVNEYESLQPYEVTYEEYNEVHSVL